MRAVLAVACAALVAGCGGSAASVPEAGDATPAASTPAAGAKDQPRPLKRKVFIRRADAACRELDAAVADAKAQSPATFPALEASARTLRDAAAKTVRRLNALTPPAGDESIVTRYLALNARSVTLLGRLRRAAAKQDRDASATIAGQLGQLQAKERALAGAYGFEVCGTQP